MGEKIIQLLKGGFIGFVKDWPIHLAKRYHETKSLYVMRNDIKEQQINKSLSKHHYMYQSKVYIYDIKE